MSLANTPKSVHKNKSPEKQATKIQNFTNTDATTDNPKKQILNHKLFHGQVNPISQNKNIPSASKSTYQNTFSIVEKSAQRYFRTFFTTKKQFRSYQQITFDESPKMEQPEMNQLFSQQFKEIVDVAMKNAMTKTIAKLISESFESSKPPGPPSQAEQSEKQNPSGFFEEEKVFVNASNESER